MDEQKIQRRRTFRSNTWTGLLFLLIGGVLLLRQTGYPLPHWLFTWPMILIVVGLFVGAKHSFNDFSWLVMILVGFVFLSDDIWPGIQIRHYAFPIIIIALGLLFIFAPRRLCDQKRRRWKERRFAWHQQRMGAMPPMPVAKEGDGTEDSLLDIVSIFSGVKKRILSKQFAGGEVVCVFGGAEINLSHADFISPVTIDVVNVFGGTKIIVPSNWEIRSEIASIFGGIDDKRPQAANSIPEKTIVLKGTIMFGGIEVNSF